MFASSSSKLTATIAAIAIAAGGGTVAASALAGNATAVDGADLLDTSLASNPSAPAAAPSEQASGDPSNPVFIAAASPAPAYRALAKSDQKPTVRVRQIADVLATRFPDVVARSAKGLTARDGTQAWVISGKAHTCLGVDNSDGTGYTCATNAEASRGSLAISEETTGGQVRSVALVPDSVSAVSAAGRQVAPSNNLVVVEYSEGSPVKALHSDGTASARID